VTEHPATASIATARLSIIVAEALITPLRPVEAGVDPNQPDCGNACSPELTQEYWDLLENGKQ
jgi:hypothetical protein